MNLIKKLSNWYGKKTILIIALLAIGLVMNGLYVSLRPSPDAIVKEVKTPTVTVKSVRTLLTGNNFSAVGEVRAIAEANLQTEAGGRVTAVNVQIGDKVKAGTIIATLENNIQRATLMQAEGAYEAAKAGSEVSLAQSGSGIRQAETNLVSAKNQVLAVNRTVYNSTNNALLVTIDAFFSNPLTLLPGVKINKANNSFLNSERVAFQAIMKDWQKEIESESITADLPAILKQAKQRTERLIVVVDELISAANKAQTADELNGRPVSSYTAGLIAERAVLSAQIQNINSAESALVSAEEAVSRASIGDNTNSAPLADAQIKIALGSLRAAQANYEKTIVRTPISGVVNALYLKAGQYVSPSTPVAIIANNNGLEISTGVSLEDSLKLKIGDEVIFDNNATGTIQAIAGAIDPTTNKVALKISPNTNGTLQNGSVVSIEFSPKVEGTTETANPTIPLSAIKMTGAGAVIFTVSTENTLVSVPVTLGTISGENVTITSGLTWDEKIVVDARGLKAGETVTVNAK